MTEGKDFVAYYRVSTRRQGESGLGLDAQQRIVKEYIKSRGGVLLEEYKEVESGKRNDRPQLEEALKQCRRRKATLVIAKLDRLSRNAAFLINLRDSRADFVACDLPDATKFNVGIMAVVAEHVREQISERTKTALRAAKRRGVKLGNPNAPDVSPLGVRVNKSKADTFAANTVPIIESVRKAGVSSLRGIAEALNARGIKTARGGDWHAMTVKRILTRSQ